ncbi:hypothetical protein Skr01_66190 [Sphaerisporangium krabiense]|nr:hypothetical protein Skr01_66190 [Sphaerisporangium krabiense]
MVLGPGEPLDPAWAEAASTAEAGRLVAEGRTVAVTLSGDETTQIAAAAVYAWLGARIFRTSCPDGVRQAIDMTDSLAGRRPPALTRRGLA